jgi:hydrocephalus-inducing protein
MYFHHSFQLNDCHRGIVIDGLDTLFSQNQFTALHALLKALNNRKFMYMVTLKQQYQMLKEKEKQSAAEQGLAHDESGGSVLGTFEFPAVLDKQKEEEERVRLEEMSEDEYDALDEEAKEEVDRKRLEIKKARRKKSVLHLVSHQNDYCAFLLREQAERSERERLEREAWEAEQRRLEEERLVLAATVF